MAAIWERYPLTYRAREIRLIARWIMAGDSGAVAGLKGCGRSHLLGFLCHRHDSLTPFLSASVNDVALIPLDIYNLASNDLASLYRTILHAFYWVRERFDMELRQMVQQHYLENRHHQDPFLPQTAVYELLHLFQNQQTRVVLVINRFDRFCQTATPQMMNSLRGLRDNFRETLSYLVGLLNDVAYLPDPDIFGDMYELFVGRVCWVGAMSEDDARRMLEREFNIQSHDLTSGEIEEILRLSGCFPNLLKAVAQWRFSQAKQQFPISAWKDKLLQEYSIQFRLHRIWTALTQAEQLALSSLPDHPISVKNLSETSKLAWAQQNPDLLEQLANKGLCSFSQGQVWITSKLLGIYITGVGSQARGGIRLDENTRTIYQGQQTIADLTPLEFEILRFMIENPYGKHTRDDVIDNAWPEEEQREGITPNALQVHIRNIRKKIEPNPAQPCYLLTWNGRPGGYQFFPEGKPILNESLITHHDAAS